MCCEGFLTQWRLVACWRWASRIYPSTRTGICTKTDLRPSTTNFSVSWAQCWLDWQTKQPTCLPTGARLCVFLAQLLVVDLIKLVSKVWVYIVHSHKKSLMRSVRLVNHSQKMCFQVTPENAKTQSQSQCPSSHLSVCLSVPQGSTTAASDSTGRCQRIWPTYTVIGWLTKTRTAALLWLV